MNSTEFDEFAELLERHLLGPDSLDHILTLGIEFKSRMLALHVASTLLNLEVKLCSEKLQLSAEFSFGYVNTFTLYKKRIRTLLQESSCTKSLMLALLVLSTLHKFIECFAVRIDS